MIEAKWKVAVLWLGPRNRRPEEANDVPRLYDELALVTAGVTSTGGITALVTNTFRSKNHRNKERDMEHLKGISQ